MFLPLRRPLFLLLPALLLMTSGCVFLRARELADENTLLQQRVQALRQDKLAVEDELSVSRNTVAELTRSLTAARGEREKAVADLQEARLRLQQVTGSQDQEAAERLARLTEREQELREQLEAERDKASSLEVQVLEMEDNLARAEEERQRHQQRLRSDLAEIERLQARVASLEGQVSSLDEELAARSAELEDATEKLTNAESDLRLLRGQMEEKEAALAGEQEKASALETELEEARQETEELKAEMLAGKVSGEVLDAARTAAEERLGRQVSSGNARVAADSSQLRLIILSDELFNPGSTVLSDTGKTILAATEDLLHQLSYSKILVEGHTDNQPIRTLPYPDNWELGAARAAEVVRWLAARPGVESGKIVAQSRSSHAPIASNNTADGRRQNRRVEIVIELEGGG